MDKNLTMTFKEMVRDSLEILLWSYGLVIAAAIVISPMCALLVCLGNPPVCRTEDELYSVEPEILEGVRPYLADWATLSPKETAEQRQQVGEELGVHISISFWDETLTGERVTTVYIPLEHWYDWTRAMVYVHDDVELIGRVRRIEEHIYVSNYNY